ncbi:MAG: response regulator transcription factor [Candidatus Promineifilaceae bacterium]|jgi:NarL family two-component system response regulator LiaR
MDNKWLARRYEYLTAAEWEVLVRGVAKGLTNPEIAEDRGTSRKTVETQVHAILRKLDVSSRTEAAIYAFRNGLMDEGGDEP